MALILDNILNISTSLEKSLEKTRKEDHSILKIPDLIFLACTHMVLLSFRQFS